MPVSPPLTVKESDGSVSVRPTNVLSFNAADFTVSGSGDTATISIDSTGTGAALTASYIGFGAPTTNLLTGSANFTFTDESGGSGPTVLLTGDKPIINIQDDTDATNYYTEFQQSSSSFYLSHKDSTGTNNEMIRVGSNYIAIQRSMTANVGIGGVPASNIALHVKGTGTGNLVRLESTDDGASAAPVLQLYRNSPSPAASDRLGEIKFSGEDSGGSEQTYCYLDGWLDDATATNEGASMYWYAIGSGTTRNICGIRGNIQTFMVNPNYDDVDFVAHGDSVSYLLHVDASQDHVSVGGSPASGGAEFQVNQDASFRSYFANQNTSAAVDASLNKNGHVVCNPSGGNITVTLGAQGTGGEKVTIMNTAADGSTVLFAVAVGDSTLTTPAAFSSGDSETWFCYKDNNWMRINSQT